MSLRIATFNVENLMNRFDFSGFRNQLNQDRTLALYQIKDEAEYRLLEQARAVAHTDDTRQLTALAIAAPFRVLLNDPSCSHNGHDCYVEAGTWNEDVEISFLGGSHEVRFWVSELVRLERGERIPFATVGPGPGHGHRHVLDALSPE